MRLICIFLLFILGQFRVCPNVQNGCDFMDVPDMVNWHITGCIYRLVPCPVIECNEKKIFIMTYFDHLFHQHQEVLYPNLGDSGSMKSYFMLKHILFHAHFKALQSYMCAAFKKRIINMYLSFNIL